MPDDDRKTLLYLLEGLEWDAKHSDYGVLRQEARKEADALRRLLETVTYVPDRNS